MRQICGKAVRKKIPIYLLLILVVFVGLFVGKMRLASQAADEYDDIWMEVDNQKIEGEYDLERASKTFYLASSGTQYADPNYKIRWEIPDINDREIIEFQTNEGDDPSKTYMKEEAKLFNTTIRAKKPGTAQVAVTVYDATGGVATVAKQVSLTINVAFAIDTSQSSDYKLVFPTDEKKSLFMNVATPGVSTGTGIKQLFLNIGESAGNTLLWTSSDEDVVKIVKIGDGDSQVTAVQAVGAGCATITAEGYGKSDSIKVYVVPRVTNNNANWSQTTLKVHSGDTLYTDMCFDINQAKSVRDKIAWAIYKRDDGGTELIEDSMGTKKSDLIELTTADSSKNLKITAKAGEYVINFYAAGTYTGEGETGNLAKQTSITVKVCAEYGERDVTINTGDYFSFADSMNITLEEFQKWFGVDWGSDTEHTTYLKYDSTKQVVEGLKETEKKSFTAIIKPKTGFEDKANALLGEGGNTESKYHFRVVDQLFLNMSNVNIVVGEEMQLTAQTATYEGELNWSSSDDTKVSVSENGMIKGLAKTTDDVTITVTQKLKNGSVKVATCKVKVDETVKDITLNKTEVEMLEGTTDTIVAKFNPDRNQAPLQWMSSDENVFTINVASDKKSVVINANKAGSAVLTALNEDNYVTAVCKVTVLAEMKSITLPSDTMTVRLSQESFKMKAVCMPLAAANNKLEWASSNADVATVDGNGVVTLVSAGITIITVKPVYNTTPPIMAQCILTVEQSATDFKIDEDTITVENGQTKTIAYTTAPIDAITTIYWSSLDSSIADVNENGEVTGKKAGSTFIIGTCEDGFSAACRVVVTQASKGVAFKEGKVIVETGESKLLEYQLNPIDATISLDWHSMDTTIAEVNDKGVVTGKKAGSTYIILTSADGYTTTCQVVVTQSATDIKFVNTEVEVEKGKTATLQYKMTPEDATSVLQWSVTDPTVASVDSQGVVTGLKVGETYVFASTAQGVTGTCKVVITQQATGLSLATEAVTVAVGSSYIMEVKYEPEDASVRTVNWKSKDEQIAEVNADGVITGKKAGKTEVIATLTNGQSASCEVTVLQRAVGITFNNSEITLENETTKAVEYLLDPVDATTVLEWTTLDNAVATVDEKGIVTGKKAGETYVVATSEDGFSATCKVIVTQKATGLKLAMTDLTLGVGSSYTMGVTIEPEDATDRGVVWTVQDSKVATVDDSGKITGMALGTTTVIAKISNGEVAYLNVVVKDALAGMNLDLENATVGIGKTILLTPQFTPATAANTKVTWTSANDAVASVDENGKVTGVAGGTTMITCTSEEGGYVSNCIVTVIENVTEIKLNHTSIKLTANRTKKLKATVSSTTATNPVIKWTSSNKKIATVSKVGTVTAKKVGSCKIKATATDGSGVSAVCNVRVIRKVSSLKINQAYIKMMEGTSRTLKSKVGPKNASIKHIKWTSSDTTLALVSSKGKITAIAPGLVTVTAETTDGSKLKATCTVNIYQKNPVTSLTVSAADVTMVRGTAQSASVSVSPVDTTDKISYSSDARSVAAVTSKGKIIARKPGTATITVTSSSGKQVYITVTVVGLNKTYMSMEQYDSDTLWVEEVSDNVKWSSSNPAIARVDNSGNVVGRKVGSCIITATVKGVKLNCKVRVTKIRPH